MSKKALWAGLALAAGTLAAATTAVLLAAPRAGSPDEGGSMASGTWSIEPADWKPERAASGPMVQLTLSGRSGHGHWNSSMPITLGELRGLGAEQMKGAAGAVNFQIVRDATSTVVLQDTRNAVWLLSGAGLGTSVSATGSTLRLTNANAGPEVTVTTIALTGRDGGEAGRLADIHLNVPDASTARVQEVHRTILHVICELVEEGL